MTPPPPSINGQGNGQSVAVRHPALATRSRPGACRNLRGIRRYRRSCQPLVTPTPAPKRPGLSVTELDEADDVSRDGAGSMAGIDPIHFPERVGVRS